MQSLPGEQCPAVLPSLLLCRHLPRRLTQPSYGSLAIAAGHPDHSQMLQTMMQQKKTGLAAVHAVQRESCWLGSVGGHQQTTCPRQATS